MPKQPTEPTQRGRRPKSQQPVTADTKRKATQQPVRKKSGPPELSDVEVTSRVAKNDGDNGSLEIEERVDNDTPENTIPPELLTRLLHEFFEHEDTRLSKDANAAASRYIDIFVREAIARCVHEQPGRLPDSFLQVEDLEKVAPQLLMDF